MKSHVRMLPHVCAVFARLHGLRRRQICSRRARCKCPTTSHSLADWQRLLCGCRVRQPRDLGATSFQPRQIHDPRFQTLAEVNRCRVARLHDSGSMYEGSTNGSTISRYVCGTRIASTSILWMRATRYRGPPQSETNTLIDPRTMAYIRRSGYRARNPSFSATTSTTNNRLALRCSSSRH